jgi:4-amino-4-deoxy-L-arabinose transferase-like glycosyltransferase
LYLSPDEALHLAEANARTLATLFTFLRQEDTHPPLHYLFNHLILVVTGQGIIEARLASLIPGILLIPLFYHLGRITSGHAAGLFMAFLASFGVQSVVQSQAIRPYALLLFLIGAALACLMHYKRTEQPTFLICYVVAFGLAIVTHFSAAIAVAAVGMVTTIELLLKRKSLHQLIAWLGAHLFLAVEGALLYHLLISDSANNTYFREEVVHDWLRSGFPLGQPIVQWFMNVLRIGDSLSIGVLPWGGLVLIFLTLAGGIVAWKRRQPELALYLLVALAANAGLALLELYPFSGGRWCLFLLPFFFLLAGSAVQAVWDKVKGELKVRQAPRHLIVYSLPLGVGTVAVITATFIVFHHDQYRTITEFPVPVHLYQSVMKHLDDNGSQNEIIVSRKTTAYYAFFESSIENVDQISPNVGRVPLRNMELFFFKNASLITSPSQLLTLFRDVKNFVGENPPKQVWFFDLGWATHPVFMNLLRTEAVSKINMPCPPIATVCLFRLPWSFIESYLSAVDN